MVKVEVKVEVDGVKERTDDQLLLLAAPAAGQGKESGRALPEWGGARMSWVGIPGSANRRTGLVFSGFVCWRIETGSSKHSRNGKVEGANETSCEGGSPWMRGLLEAFSCCYCRAKSALHHASPNSVVSDCRISNCFATCSWR